MNQSRTMSLVEAVTSAMIGYLVAVMMFERSRHARA
jgi:hypothetical protein